MRKGTVMMGFPIQHWRWLSTLFLLILNVDSSAAPPFPLSSKTSPGAKILEVYNPAGVQPDGVFVDKLLYKTMKELNKNKPPSAGNFPEVRVEKIPIKKDEFAEINTLFYKRGWTDGLPIVPPTKLRVQEMLIGADLNPDYVVGILDPMGGQATIEKIAVNAVMAGCRPEYMPVLIAAVEAVANPAFDLRGIATTTNPDTPMLIISGPMGKQLALNSGTNALGRGWQANSSMGRAVHLIIQNIGGSWPGITDMSCLGQPGEFAMCLAESEEANPWAPLHMDLGHPKAANVVTVIGAEGMHSIRGIGQSSEGYLKLVADHLIGLDRPYRSVVLLIIAQDTAAKLAREGWTKEKIKEFIVAHAKMPFARYKERFIDTDIAKRLEGVPPWVYATQDPHALIPMPFIDQLLLLVSGGPGEKSMLIPGWTGGKTVSKEVRLPTNWERLLEKARK